HSAVLPPTRANSQSAEARTVVSPWYRKTLFRICPDASSVTSSSTNNRRRDPASLPESLAGSATVALLLPRSLSVMSKLPCLSLSPPRCPVADGAYLEAGPTLVTTAACYENVSVLCSRSSP